MPDEAIPYAEIKDRITAISDERDKALFAVLYGTGGRVGEVCGTSKYRGLTIYGVEERTFPVILGEKIEKMPFVVVTLETEKHPKHPLRAIPINASVEPWLTEPILKHAEFVKLKGKTKLFPFTTRWAQKLCKLHLNTNPHMLRHSRLTHWAKHFGLAAELQQLAGHSRYDSAGTYLHLNSLDAARKMSWK